MFKRPFSVTLRCVALCFLHAKHSVANGLFAGVIALLASVTSVSAVESGRIVNDLVDSKALAANLLHDPSERKVLVYLPPGYDRHKDRRYPVLYLLHGNGIPVTVWVDNPFGWQINKSLDAGIADKSLAEMIVVMPDAYNAFQGSQYVDSETTGGWETFITKELVSYIDGHYRTIATPEGRGLAGHSMGGRATLYYAMRHPGEYIGFYAISAGVLGFDDYTPLFHDRANWKALAGVKAFDEASITGKKLISFAAAYSPNPDKPPFYADFPYTWEHGALVKDPVTWARWIAHDPFVLPGVYLKGIKRAAHLHFECGLQDPFIVPNLAFDEELNRLGISHTFSSFKGNHTDHLPQRVSEGALPYFSHLFKGE